eukprot:6438645-Ditylum_brightwellii.AAC.1
MDNLYNSASFCRADYNHEPKVLCHGVARKGGRGIPDCVKQKQQKSKVNQRLVCETVNAAVHEGDPRYPCLIASSVYDTKPVHYLSMIMYELKWVVKQNYKETAS